MRYLALAWLLCSLAFPALAKNDEWPPKVWPPFTWPEAFSVVISESSVSKGGAPRVTRHYRTEERVRTDTEASGGTEVELIDLEKQSRILFKPGLPAQQSAVPSGWKPDNFFPAGDQWEELGTDPINGKRAKKFKIWRDTAQAERLGQEPYVLLWLVPNKRTPLRMVDGDRLVIFSGFVEGEPDEKVFELPPVR